MSAEPEPMSQPPSDSEMPEVADDDLELDVGASQQTYSPGEHVFAKSAGFCWWPAQILDPADKFGKAEAFEGVPEDRIVVGFFGTLQHGPVTRRSLRRWEEHTVPAEDREDSIFKVAFAQAAAKMDFWQLLRACEQPGISERFWAKACQRIYDAVDDRRKWYRRYVLWLSKHAPVDEKAAVLPVFNKTVTDPYAVYVCVELLGGYVRLENPQSMSANWGTITFLPLFIPSQRHPQLAARVREYYRDHLLPFHEFLDKNAKNIDKVLTEKDLKEGQLVYMVNCSCGHYHRNYRREREVCRVCDRKGDLVQCNVCQSWCHISCMIGRKLIENRSKLKDSKFQFSCWFCRGPQTHANGGEDERQEESAVVPSKDVSHTSAASLQQSQQSQGSSQQQNVKGRPRSGAGQKRNADHNSEDGASQNLEESPNEKPAAKRVSTSKTDRTNGTSAVDSAKDKDGHKERRGRPPKRDADSPAEDDEGEDEHDDGSAYNSKGGRAVRRRTASDRKNRAQEEKNLLGDRALRFMWLREGPKTRLEATLVRVEEEILQRERDRAALLHHQLQNGGNVSSPAWLLMNGSGPRLFGSTSDLQSAQPQPSQLTDSTNSSQSQSLSAPTAQGNGSVQGQLPPLFAST